jgi:hypothetical protein
MRNKIKFALLPVVSRAFIWSAHRFYERKPFHDCMGLNSFQLTEEFLVPSLVRVTFTVFAIDVLILYIFMRGS